MKRLINPMDYLDLNNWGTTFPIFIEATDLDTVISICQIKYKRLPKRIRHKLKRFLFRYN